MARAEYIKKTVLDISDEPTGGDGDNRDEGDEE